jgi:hypothetical protein
MRFDATVGHVLIIEAAGSPRVHYIILLLFMFATLYDKKF